jgi:hypothetical protein
MRSKLPVAMILQRIEEEGDMSGLSVLADGMAHLPKAREFASSTEMMAKAFRASKELAEDDSLMLHAHKLASMSKRMFKDRETLKPVLECVRAVLAEWGAWAEADDPTEEEIQGHLERVAGAISNLNDALSAYDSFVLKKLKEGRGTQIFDA